MPFPLPELLLTTTGARSGRPHTTPLGYVRDERGRPLVTGSAGGAPHHPAWYHNLLAHPMTEVELGTETFPAVAVPAEGADRDRLFDLVVRAAPGFADDEEKAGRKLPVVALERVEAEGAPAEATNLADKLLQGHAWLRHQLGRVRAEADAYFAGDTGAGLGLQIRQHCLAFCEGLHFHHTGEEMAVFPALEKSHPGLTAALARLRAEHVTVERIRGELEALLGDMAGADRARFRAEVERMTSELDAHLAYEEEQLLPALAAIPWPPVAP
ncbi:nitroreductase/quinone reductase family protein [Streptomyces coryli]|uniref:nitroreductase/quinone reductase family protein n=1 Tax=Streptomyces coryli TaxID=1128680 RepID=UPI001F0D5CEA|nr:nitroreductase/quinone reductase family protein [Streptomyces coryli]